MNTAPDRGSIELHETRRGGMVVIEGRRESGRGRTITLWAAIVAAVVLAAGARPAGTFLLEAYYLRKLARGDQREQAIAVEKLGELQSARAVKDLLEILARSAQESPRVRAFFSVRENGLWTDAQFPISQFVKPEKALLSRENAELSRKAFLTLSEADVIDLFRIACREARFTRHDVVCHRGILSLSTGSPKLVEDLKLVVMVMNEWRAVAWLQLRGACLSPSSG